MDATIQQVHFIGIGGVGMSGIARVAHDQGMIVSGSDLKESRYTTQLKEAGIQVFIGQCAENIPEGNPVIVVSTAILENNPELIEAKRRGLTVWHRAQMLARLGAGLETLAVAGTHGKTTTSSMLATVLDTMGEDPTFLIGGIVRAYGTNARSGKGGHYVVEADESDKSFTHLSPRAVLVTNIEADHLDHYSGLDEIYSQFGQFMSSVPEEGGVIVACGDDEGLVKLASAIDRPVVTYGFGENCDARIINCCAKGVGSEFTLQLPDGTTVDCAVKQNPGAHNVLNAAGVVTLLAQLGYDPERAAKAMSEFAGVKRRFDLIGTANEITVVDDYAHHPTEIAATIQAAKQLDFKRVIVLFQPHRYSRVKLFTEVLAEEFSCAFDQADLVVFTDVFPAGEMPVPGINGQTFLQVIQDHEGCPETRYIHKRIEVVPGVTDILQPGDLLITMGAGDITAAGPRILSELQLRSL